MPRLVAVVTAAMLIVGCGGGGEPQSFDDDPGEIAVVLIPALEPGSDPASVPAMHRNFLDGCVTGAGGSLPELATVQQQGLLAVCGCSYPVLVQKYRSEALAAAEPGATADDIEKAAVDLFLDLDDSIRDGSELPEDVVLVVAECIKASAF